MQNGIENIQTDNQTIFLVFHSECVMPPRRKKFQNENPQLSAE